MTTDELAEQKKIARLEKKFNGYKFGQLCTVHDHNSVVPLEDHHIHPREYHGPDTKENKARVCSNGHGEVHYYLELLLFTGKTKIPEAERMIPWYIRRYFGSRVRFLATAGFRSIMASEVTESGIIPVTEP